MDAPRHNWEAYKDVYSVFDALSEQSYDHKYFLPRPSVLFDQTFTENKNKREFTFLFRIPSRQVKYKEEGGLDNEFATYYETHCPFSTSPKYTLTKQTVQIGYTQAARFGADNTVEIPQQLIDGALGLFVPMVANHLRMQFRQVIEVQGRLNPSTANGWPLSSRFRIKSDVLKVPIWKVAYSGYFSAMSKPLYPPSIYTSNVKFELRTYEKVIDDEARTFMPCPIFTQLLWMQYFSAYDDSIAATAKDTPFCMGFSDKYGGADELARYLRFVGEVKPYETVAYMESDVSAWDRSTQIAMLKMAWQAMEMNFPESYRSPAHKQRLQNMFHDMVFTPVLMEYGDTFQTHNGVKSGHPGTLTINSLMHIMMVFCAIVWMKPDITVEELRRSFRFKVQGDDFLGSRIIQRTPWFSVAKYKEFVALCGYILKHFRESFKLEDLEFIGGNLVPTEYGVWLMKPNRLKIVDACYHHKATDPRCVMSKLLSLKVLSFPDTELYKFMCGYTEWYWKRHEKVLRIPYGEEPNGDAMFTYAKLKAQDLTDSAIRKIYYGFQMEPLVVSTVYGCAAGAALNTLIGDCKRDCPPLNLNCYDSDPKIVDIKAVAAPEMVRDDFITQTAGRVIMPIAPTLDREITEQEAHREGGHAEYMHDIQCDLNSCVHRSWERREWGREAFETAPTTIFTETKMGSMAVPPLEEVFEDDASIGDISPEHVQMRIRGFDLCRICGEWTNIKHNDMVVCAAHIIEDGEEDDEQELEILRAENEELTLRVEIIRAYNLSVSEPRLNDNIRNKESMGKEKKLKHASQKAKAGLLSPEGLRAARKAEKAARKQMKKAFKKETKQAMHVSRLPTAAATTAAAAIARANKPVRVPGPKPGYAGVFDDTHAMSKRRNVFHQVSRGKGKNGLDEAVFFFVGNWQGTTLTTDAATPPTLCLDGTLQTIRMNGFTLGAAAAAEMQNWEEYDIELFVLWIDMLQGTQNTPGLIHTGIVEDAAQLVASGQSVSVDFIDSLKIKAVTPVYNQEKPMRLTYNHKTARKPQEWFKVYASSQTISTAPVVAEIRQCYQFAVVAYPQACTASTQLGQFQTQYRIKVRGWKTPLALVRGSIENAADAVMAHHAGQLALKHEEYHARKRMGEKVEEPPYLVNPRFLPALLAEVERYEANIDFLDQSERKAYEKIKYVAQMMVNFRNAVRKDMAKKFPIDKYDVKTTADVAMSVTPVVIVDKSIALDPRVNGLASAASVSSTGVLSCAAGGTSGVQDVRILGSDSKTPVYTKNDAVVFSPDGSSVAAAVPLCVSGGMNPRTTSPASVFAYTALRDSITGAAGADVYVGASPMGVEQSTTGVTSGVGGYVVQGNYDNSLKVGGAGVSGYNGASFTQTTGGNIASSVYDPSTGNPLAITSNGVGKFAIYDPTGANSIPITAAGVLRTAAYDTTGVTPVAVGATGQLKTSICSSAGTNSLIVGSGGNINATITDAGASRTVAVSTNGALSSQVCGPSGDFVTVGTNGQQLTTVCDSAGVVKMGVSGGAAKMTLYDSSGSVAASVGASGQLKTSITDNSASNNLVIGSGGNINSTIINSAATHAANVSTSGSLQVVSATAASSSDGKTGDEGSGSDSEFYASIDGKSRPMRELTAEDKRKIRQILRGKSTRRSRSLPQKDELRRVFTCCGQAGEVAGDTYTCPTCKKTSVIARASPAERSVAPTVAFAASAVDAGAAGVNANKK